MLLREILYEARQQIWGHWRIFFKGNQRQWIPAIRGDSCRKYEREDNMACLPSRLTDFEPVTNRQSTIKIRGESIPYVQSQAFKLWKAHPASLTTEQRRLMEQLQDALKRRSTEDIISDADFTKLMEHAMTVSVGGIRGSLTSGDRMVLVVPASSSSVIWHRDGV